MLVANKSSCFNIGSVESGLPPDRDARRALGSMFGAASLRLYMTLGGWLPIRCLRISGPQTRTMVAAHDLESDLSMTRRRLTERGWGVRRQACA